MRPCSAINRRCASRCVGAVSAVLLGRCAGPGAGPICCSRSAAPSTTARSAPVSGRNSCRPTTHTRQWRWPPDPQLCDGPEGTRLLATVKAGDVVITAKLDRMFRSALDALAVLGQLQQRGVSLHMIDLGGDVTGNGISKLVFTILSAVAEAERDRIRERIRDVKADQKRRMRYLGGIVPFGWSVGSDGELIEVPDQQAAIRRARKLRDQGLSLRAISAAL